MSNIYKASVSQAVPAVMSVGSDDEGEIVVRVSVEYPESAGRHHLTDVIQSATDTLIFSLTGEAPE